MSMSYEECTTSAYSSNNSDKNSDVVFTSTYSPLLLSSNTLKLEVESDGMSSAAGTVIDSTATNCSLDLITATGNESGRVVLPLVKSVNHKDASCNVKVAIR